MLLGLELVDVMGFALIVILGFLPLGIIHWADPTFTIDSRRLSHRLRRIHVARAGLVSIVGHWISELIS